MRWFWALVLIAGLAFALGLRIHLKALGEKLLNRPDHNIEALLKMGINPEEVGYKSNSWWTFRSENNLFNRFHFNLNFGGQSKMMQDAWAKAQAMTKKVWGSGPGEIVDDQAQQAAAQARRTQSRVEEQVRSLQKQ